MLGKRSNVIDQVSELIWAQPNVLRRDMSMAILDHVEQFSVCFVLHRRRVAEVDERELLGDRHFTFAITVVPVAHRTIVTALIR